MTLFVCGQLLHECCELDFFFQNKGLVLSGYIRALARELMAVQF